MKNQNKGGGKTMVGMTLVMYLREAFTEQFWEFTQPLQSFKDWRFREIMR